MNGIYFRDILLTRISRGANNCGQHPLEKNIYFIMRFSPHFQLFYFNDRLEFCEFFEGKIKRINNADLFSQLPLLIFIKGANISGGHCIYLYLNYKLAFFLLFFTSVCPAFLPFFCISFFLCSIFLFVSLSCLYIYLFFPIASIFIFPFFISFFF